MTLDDFTARWTGHVPKVQDLTGEYAVLVPLAQRPEGLSLLYEVRADSLGRQQQEQGPRPAAQVAHPVPPPHRGEGGQGQAVLSPEGVEKLRPSPAEVKETFWAPVDWLRAHPPAVYTYDLVPDVRPDFPYDRIGFPQGYRWRGGRAEVPVYDWPGHPIWGLTGRITRHLMEHTP